MTDYDTTVGLQTLMTEFARSGLMTLHVRHDDFEVLLSNDPGVGSLQRRQASPEPTRIGTLAPLPAVAAAKPVASSPTHAAELPANAMIVGAPNLGTFYRAPKPGAENYVRIGSEVAIGQEICLIEVMKLFTAVRSEQVGRVHAILAEDGAMVEAGQPLFARVEN